MILRLTWRSGDLAVHCRRSIFVIRHSSFAIPPPRDNPVAPRYNYGCHPNYANTPMSTEPAAPADERSHEVVAVGDRRGACCCS